MSYASSAYTFLRLLQPSWHGGLFTILGSICVIATIFVPLFYEGSLADLYIDTAISNQTGFFSDFSRLSSAVETSDSVGDATIFIIWALVGLAVYYVMLSFLGAASNTFRFVQLVEYFKADRKRLEMEAFIRLSIRLIAIVSIYLVYRLFIIVIFPYVLYFTHKALLISPLYGAAYLAVACILLILAIHVFIVLIRLMLLRYRIFRGSADIIYE